jgi:hypothetical protein
MSGRPQVRAVLSPGRSRRISSDRLAAVSIRSGGCCSQGATSSNEALPGGLVLRSDLAPGTLTSRITRLRRARRLGPGRGSTGGSARRAPARHHDDGEAALLAESCMSVTLPRFAVGARGARRPAGGPVFAQARADVRPWGPSRKRRQLGSGPCRLTSQSRYEAALDMAGLREGAARVEQLGMARTRALLAAADLAAPNASADAPRGRVGELQASSGSGAHLQVRPRGLDANTRLVPHSNIGRRAGRG